MFLSSTSSPLNYALTCGWLVGDKQLFFGWHILSLRLFVVGWLRKEKVFDSQLSTLLCKLRIWGSRDFKARRSFEAKEFTCICIWSPPNACGLGVNITVIIEIPQFSFYFWYVSNFIPDFLFPFLEKVNPFLRAFSSTHTLTHFLVQFIFDRPINPHSPSGPEQEWWCYWMPTTVCWTRIWCPRRHFHFPPSQIYFSLDNQI